jgi:predicted DNA-binding transcriptional regulator YafY
MTKRESIIRQSLIIKKLRKNPAGFQEIMDRLDLESEMLGYDLHISKRTFQRDLNDIRSIYDIDIRYDPYNKVYRIDFDDNEAANERILEAFDIFNALNITDRLSDYIHFEKRKPQGTENLYGLLHAIKNRFQVGFTYRKFWEDESTRRKVEPYALKESKNRWYLLARQTNEDYIKTFGLDRMTDLTITKKKFRFPAGFDVNEFFKYAFGIIVPGDGQPEEIILSFTPLQGKYVRSLPLHDSQEVILNNAEEMRISLKVFITRELITEILSFGNEVKVLKPPSLIEEVKKQYQSALKRYE